MAPYGGWAHGFVCFLGIFAAIGVAARGVRGLIGAVVLGDITAQVVNGFVGQGDRVGTHVGDQAHGAGADVHTFIQLLCDAHGALRGEAQFAHRFLLQRGGGEGRRRVAVALFFFDVSDL